MTNPLYSMILEELGQILTISKDELESDVKDMTKCWESCLEKVQVTNRENAIFVLNTCVRCYLRGRSIGSGSHHTLKQNHGMQVALATVISLYVSKQSADFPEIHKFVPIGIDNLENVCEQGDVLAQAEQILRERQGY
jgi:hypothetical protein